ncbi:MAG: carbohydrate ABC transporter permease [Chloroflexi bacterium]|nr:carbohydrate ABC transporter permease [Chloroflexota bacterium]
MKGVQHILTYSLLVAGSLLMVGPFVWMVTSALKTPDELIAVPPVWWPGRPMWRNFVTVFTVLPLARMFLNSIVITAIISVAILLTSSLAGFGLAKYEWPGRDAVFVGILGTMMVPFFVLLIPLYFVVKTLGWLNTYQGLIMPNVVTAFGIFLMRQFILSLPDELLDSARIDGATEFRIYWQIVLPLLYPALAALGIFAFIYHWDSFLWPLLVIHSPSLYTVPIGLNSLRSFASSQQYLNLLMAGTAVAVTPSIAVFVTLQRHFVRGIALTGVRG